MKKLILIIFFISSSYALAESQLPNCQGSDFTKYNNCFGEVTYPDGSKYVGEFKDGLANGQGTLTSANGEKYVGEFKDGKRLGQGSYASKYGGDAIKQQDYDYTARDYFKNLFKEGFKFFYTCNSLLNSNYHNC